MIGRKKEQRILNDCLESKQAEFLVVYGRRRVGKTFLVKEFFSERFAFYATGVTSTNTREQLGFFNESLKEYGSTDKRTPKNWREAFMRLKTLLSDSSVKRDPVTNKRVVFLDELPWMDTARSDFKSSLDYFWNSWGSTQKDLLLIVCGSATSWIIDNIIADRGGFYNRVTRKIHLLPFSLGECEQFIKSKDISMSRQDMVECYMVFGGIPYYLNLLDRRLSLAQNVDMLLFSEEGQLYYEYEILFRSLFKYPDKHFSIMQALSKRKYGLTRSEVIDKTHIADGKLLTKALSELEKSGFIRRYKNVGKKTNGALFQIIDPFSLFCLEFIIGRKKSSWLKYIRTPGYNAWVGLSFETVCLNHIPQIKNALGISGVESEIYTWRSRQKEGGAQIDLLIDRDDNVINICEMKYSKGLFAIDSKYEKELNHKMDVFADETKTRKTLHMTMVTVNGVERNEHSDVVINEITSDDLFI